MKQTEIEGLLEVAEMLFQADQYKLAAAIAREQELRQNLKSLEISRRERALAMLGQADAAMVAGADAQWQIWVEQRRRLINLELAKCLVEQDQLRRCAKKSFGRTQAATAILQDHIAKRKQLRVRKSYYAS